MAVPPVGQNAAAPMPGGAAPVAGGPVPGGVGAVPDRLADGGAEPPPAGAARQPQGPGFFERNVVKLKLLILTLLNRPPPAPYVQGQKGVFETCVIKIRDALVRIFRAIVCRHNRA